MAGSPSMKWKIGWWITAGLALLARPAAGLGEPPGATAPSPAAAPSGLPAGSPDGGRKESEEPARRPHGVVGHVAVIGASISAGFNTSGMAGLPFANLAYALRKMLPEGCIAESYADTLVFQDPEARCRRQVSGVRRAKPTALIAVDFPFWWVYGVWNLEEDRIPTLERGLKMLEEAQDAATKVDGRPVPVLIALLPDTHGLVGPTVPHPLQTPEKAMIDQCNARLRAWAAEREGVIVVPLLEDFDAIRAKQKLKIGEREIDVDKEEPLLQPDGLHTTVEGLAFVAARCIEAMASHGLVDPEVKYDDPYGLAARLRTEGPR